jgi:hypothetical protein
MAWPRVAASQPANPADPADPAYNFAPFDAAVQDASARGLRVLITFYGVPAFAEGPGKPAGWKYPETWKPDPAAFGSFVTAVATRYSGTYGGLPAVRDYEAWNEPNLDLFLSPQYRGKRLVAPDLYRDLVNAAADALHGVSSANRLIVGSNAPYGDPPGGSRTRPLVFLRDLFCLNQRLRGTACPSKTSLDVFSHHPINFSGPPRTSALSPDDASSPDLGRVMKVLRAAERARSIESSRKRHQLWVTEFWWQSKPAKSGPATATLAQHGRWLEEALYLFWRAGAKVAINFELRDELGSHTGVLADDGSRKPAYTAMRFPFVVVPRSAERALAWGRAPESGRMVIERRRGGRWSAVKRLNVKAGKVFSQALKVGGDGRFRATVGAERSLVWTRAGSNPR